MDRQANAPNLPDWLSPLLVREIRQDLRANQFAGLFLTLHAIALASFGLEMAAGQLVEQTGILRIGTGGILNLPLFLFFGLIFPGAQLTALQPETGPGRNIELLAVSNLSRWQVVRDKWLSGMSLSILALISLLPYFLIQPLIGKGSFSEALSSIVFLAELNIFTTAIFLGASGFRSYLVRAILIIFYLITFAISLMLLKTGPDAAKGSLLIRDLAGLLCEGLFILLALQLGRSKLQIGRNPLEPPSSALILLITFCCPVLIGCSNQLLSQWGGWIAAGLVAVGLLFLERDKGTKRTIQKA